MNIAKILLSRRISYISWLALLSLLFFTLGIGAADVVEDNSQLELGYIQLNIKNLYIDSFFPVISDQNEQIFLPLSSLFRALELTSFHWEEGLLSGVIQTHGQDFIFNLETGQVRSGEESFILSPDQYFLLDDEVYVDYQILSSWLPISCNWDPFRYEIFIYPEFKLVSEILQERQEIRDRLLGSETVKPENVRQVNSTFFTPGIFTYQLGVTYPSSGEMIPNLSVGYRGRLFYGDYYGQIEFNPEEKFKLKTSHLKYYDLPGGKEVILGDNLLFFSRLLNKTSLIKGLSLASPEQQYNYGLTSLTGFVPPGSDVELYYRGRLIDYQKTSDGIYRFQNISVEGPSNLYEIWVYPPDGRIYSEKKQVLSQKNLLAPQAYDYSGGFGQSSQGFLATGQLYYGLTQRLTMGGGLTVIERADQLEKYLGGEILTQLRPNTLLSLEGQLDIERMGLGYLAEVTNVHKDLLTKVKYKGYFQSTPPLREQLIFDDQLLSLTNEVTLEMEKRFADRSLGLRYRFADFSGNWVQQLETRYHQQLSRWALLNLENRLTFLPSGIDEDLFQATLVYSGWSHLDLKTDAKLSINRSGIDYYNLYFNLQEKKRLKKRLNYALGVLLSDHQLDVLLEVEYQITDGLIGKGFFNRRGFSLAVSFQETRVAEWPFQKITNGSLDTGMISGRVFLDQNNNGSWDLGELVFPQVKILVDGHQQVITDEQGEYFLLDLDADQKLRISLDLKTLDALYLPKEKAIWAQVKPGTELVVDIPVVTCSGISGYILGTEKQLRSLREDNLAVILTTLDGQEIARSYPEWDGFFILEQIQPGDYLLQVETIEDLLEPKSYRINIPCDQLPQWFDGYNFRYK